MQLKIGSLEIWLDQSAISVLAAFLNTPAGLLLSAMVGAQLAWVAWLWFRNRPPP